MGSLFKRAQAKAKQIARGAIQFVRYHGLYIGSAFEVVTCGSVGDIVSPSILNLLQGKASATDVAYAAISAALGLWFVVGIGGMVPIPAVKPPDSALSVQERKRLNRQIKRRNALIFNISVIDVTASLMYVLAGSLLGNRAIIISGLAFCAAALVRCVLKQGEKELAFPSLPKGLSWQAYAKAYGKHVKELSLNNPNLLAEFLCMPGVLFSCIGLVQVLPLTAALIAVGGDGLAILVRALSIARQKEIVGNLETTKKGSLVRQLARQQVLVVRKDTALQQKDWADAYPEAASQVRFQNRRIPLFRYTYSARME